MKKKVLKNGLTVIHQQTNNKSIAVCALVKVGSNFESEKNHGISHFIEHMLFEGTKTRTALEISQAVEGLGGEINAYTTNERTCFQIKSLRRNLEKSLEILSDLIKNPLFDDKYIEKERIVILSEVLLKKDQPTNYQWELFFKSAFKGYRARHPIIGYEKTVRKITRKDLLAFFKKYYSSNNIIISIVGDLKDPFGLIEKYFGDMKPKKKIKKQPLFNKRLKKNSLVVDKRKIQQAYMVIGYPAVPVGHKDSNTIDVIRAILGKGMSGRLFNEIRNKRGLGYDVGAYYESNISFGFLACYVSSKQKNIKECERIIHEELRRVSDISKKELDEVKNFLEGEFIFNNEANEKLADLLAIWEYAGELKEFEKEIQKIRKIQKKDIRRAAEKYITPHFAKAVIFNPKG